MRTMLSWTMRRIRSLLGDDSEIKGVEMNDTCR